MHREKERARACVRGVVCVCVCVLCVMPTHVHVDTQQGQRVLPPRCRCGNSPTREQHPPQTRRTKGRVSLSLARVGRKLSSNPLAARFCPYNLELHRAEQGT